MVLPPRNGLSLCAGAGGLDMGLMLAEPDFHTRCWVEWEPEPRERIIAAQRAGYFAPAPIWDDLTAFDARPLAGCIDTLLAGYPCQPFSQAGQRRGEDDERHLYPHVSRVADELGDGLEWIFLENVAGHLSLGLEAVLRDLWGLGFIPAAGLFTAAETGATHERKRLFIVAHRPSLRTREQNDEECPVARDDTWSGACRSGGRLHGELAHRDGQGCGRSEDVQSGGETAARECGADIDRPDRDMGDAGGERRQQDAGSSHGHEGQNEGRTAQYGHEPSSAGDHVDDTAGARSEGARGWADERCDRDKCREQVSGDGRDELADSDHARPQRQQRHQLDAEGRQNEARHARLRGGAGLFPPGPGDLDAWAAALRSDPSCAPALSRRDAKAAALYLASVVPPDAAARIVQRAAGLQTADLLREVETEAAHLVDAQAAVTRFRRMADGMAQRSRALRILGNGVAPLAAAYAWRSLSASHCLGWLDLGSACEGTSRDRTTAGAARPVRGGVA